MAHVHELIFSTRDAEALARLLAEHRRANAFEADASDALAELMMDARFVADDALPEGTVALGSRVGYAGEGGARRAVIVVEPAEADPAAGRISVLSPIGLALVGRRRGMLTEARLPNGRTLGLRLLEVSAPLAAAA